MREQPATGDTIPNLPRSPEPSATSMPAPTSPPANRARTPRILFVPVSGPHGSGELMRCLIVARALRRAAPQVDIHFLVSRDAVFRDAVDFTVHDCDDSPTRSTPQVIAALRTLRPDVAVFDNAGRTSQLRAARAAGTRLVFASRSPRLRWKAFRLSWLALLDEHWIVFPKFVTGGLSLVERLKISWSSGYVVRHLDTLFTPSEPETRRAWLATRGLAEGTYAVFVPGGRGEHQGTAVDPAQVFVDAAREYARGAQQPTVVLTGWPETGSASMGRTDTSAPPAPTPGLLLLPFIRPEEVQHMLAGAALVISNGGTTLVHALAHRRVIVSVPLADDQARRIRRAARLGVVVPAPLDAGRIAQEALALARDPQRCARMREQVDALGLMNGADVAVAALRRLANA